MNFKWLKQTRIHHLLLCKRTLNNLDHLTKWLSCVVSTFWHSAFDCMFLSSHIHVSEWICTLELHECTGTHCSKYGSYLKFKRLQWHSNLQQLISYSSTWSFSQLGQMIELCCGYLSVRCIWLCCSHIQYAFQSQSTPHSCLYVKELLAQNRCHTEV